PLLDQLRVAELDDAGHRAFARERTGAGGTRSGGHADILPHSESSALDAGARAVFTESVTQRAVLTFWRPSCITSSSEKDRSAGRSSTAPSRTATPSRCCVGALHRRSPAYGESPVLYLPPVCTRRLSPGQQTTTPV